MPTHFDRFARALAHILYDCDVRIFNAKQLNSSTVCVPSSPLTRIIDDRNLNTIILSDAHRNARHELRTTPGAKDDECSNEPFELLKLMRLSCERASAYFHCSLGESAIEARAS